MNSAMSVGTLQLLITFPGYRHAKIYLGTRRQWPLRKGACSTELVSGIRQIANANTFREDCCSSFCRLLISLRNNVVESSVRINHFSNQTLIFFTVN